MPAPGDAGAFQVQSGALAVSSVLVTFSPNRQSATLTASLSADGRPRKGQRKESPGPVD